MSTDRGPGIRIPPPSIMLAVFLVGIWLDLSFVRIRLVGGSSSPRWLRITGWLLMAMGGALALWGVRTFRRSKTNVLPFRPATTVVSVGPYRYTRNPMYLGMALAYIGGALALNAGWPLLLLPVALLTLYLVVIRREEAYLARTFGDAYAEYRTRVRRWL
jgi:protein-S-isoprenylcysteine O-methyltransferase Ste14